MRKLSLGLVLLLALAMAASGLGTLLHSEPVAEGFSRLGLPAALMTLVGSYKLLGVVGLLATAVRPMPRLREWVFAGFTFNMLGAAFLHASAGDTLAQTAPVVLLLGLVQAAYWTSRPVA